jgi:hypothetical protein
MFPTTIFTPARLFICLALMTLSQAVNGATGAGPDAYGYTAALTTLDFEDLTSPDVPSTGILNGSEDDTVTIPIGFPFVFYGVSYTTVTVSTNGLISFGGPEIGHLALNINTTKTPADLPTICPLWHDWSFQYAGSDEALYVTLGDPGNRRLIVQWDFAQAALPSPSVDTVTFQVKLFERSNNIEFHYYDATVSDDASVSNGKASTVGIRDKGGQNTNRSLQWSFNQSVFIADQTAIKYTAPKFKVNAITRPTSTTIFLDCTGAPSISNKILSTTNLLTTAFSTQANVTADAAGHFTYTDPNTGPATPRRFYRVGLP